MDADFRLPSLDYEDLINATKQLCQNSSAMQLQFRRALFNLLALNQDDHSKNWAFQQSDNGKWQPSPFYDITFSPQAFGEQVTAFNGYGKCPPVKIIQKLADLAEFDSWETARQEIINIVEVLNTFTKIARQFGVKEKTIFLINHQLQNNLQNLKYLYQSK